MKMTANYINNIKDGLFSLFKGMWVTIREFFTRKVTEEYPDNRTRLKLSERFRGALYMPRNADGTNRCTACGLCEMSCPNETLHLDVETLVDETTGRKKKRLLHYRYDLGSCMFCQLCTNVCPAGAIAFTTRFEHAVFNRQKLIMTLNS
jgi:NADH-quinone oxidoreductase subunit I